MTKKEQLMAKRSGCTWKSIGPGKSPEPLRGLDKPEGVAANAEEVRKPKARKQGTRRPRRNKKADSKNKKELDASTGKSPVDSKQRKQPTRSGTSSEQSASVIPDLSGDL